MIIQENKCVYLSYYDYLDWMNKPIPNYMNKCESCQGQKDCHITLDELIEVHQVFKSEMDVGSLL